MVQLSTTNVETSMANSQTELKQRLMPHGKTNTTAGANGFPTKNGQPLVSVADGEVKAIQLKHNVNLDEYTKNFKGAKILGIQFEAPLKWHNIIAITFIHLYFLYAHITYPLHSLKFTSLLFAFFTGGLNGFGITGGAHRYWTHRSYKANLPARIILMLLFSLAGQNSLYDWVRDHRVHHKYSETDADPHNAKRGFFFAHCGWLMMHKHPEVLRRGRQIDMSDILADPVVRFHEKYFIPLKIVMCFVLPTVFNVYVFGEEWYNAFVLQCIFRYVYALNFTWSVNSAAHLWGTRPYDRRINPRENKFVSIIAVGEGWHNYHHVFPWDYKAAELGNYSLNITTMYLDLLAKIGWVWDRKQPSKELIYRTLQNHGDGSHPSVQIDLDDDDHHIPEVPDPEFQSEDEDAESSSTESTKLDENDNMSKKSLLA